MKLSIVIPALNEAAYLEPAVRAARANAGAGAPHELIVADCGSTDGTPALARALGACVVTASPPPDCRAAALNAGASQASGDVLLFLDPDTLLPEGYDESIMRALADPGTAGGAFEFALDGRGFGLRLVELINRTRYRIWPWYYGDQGIFVRRPTFERLGGYPDRRIMEASEFCKRLRRTGKLALIDKCATTSARRFQEGGVYSVLANDIRIWWLDITGRPTEQFAHAYREENLLRGQPGKL